MYFNFPVKEEVLYLSGDRAVFLPYQEMLKSLKNGIPNIEYHPTYELKNIDVQSVLELFETRDQTLRSIYNYEENKTDINPIINFSPQINVNSQFTNNPTINYNSLETNNDIPQDNPKSKKLVNIIEIEKKIKEWKVKAILVFIISLILTILLVLFYVNDWGFSVNDWKKLKDYDILKWGGLIVAFVWNTFIGKSVYDRLWDPTKEKAYREKMEKIQS